MEDLQGTVGAPSLPRSSGDDAVAHAEAQWMFGAPPPVDEPAALREAQRLFGNGPPVAPSQGLAPAEKRCAMKACPQCTKLIPNRCETCPACGGCAVRKRSAKRAKAQDGVPPAWTDAAAALAAAARRDPQKVVFGPQGGARDVSAAPGLTEAAWAHPSMQSRAPFAAGATAEVPPVTQVGLVPSHLARAAPSWFPAETAGAAAPAPAAVEAPLTPEACTYEGVWREDGVWGAEITLDDGEVKSLGTYANAGAAAWAYDAAREERGLPPVNFPLPGQAPAPVAEAPAPAEDEEAPLPVTTAADDEKEQDHQSVAAPSTPAPECSEAAPPPPAPLWPPAPKPHVASAASAWATVCTDLLAAVGDRNGMMDMRSQLVSAGFRCGNLVAGKSYFNVSVPLTFPCYFDVAGKDYTSCQDVLRSEPQLTKYFEGCLALARTGGAYRTEADREADDGEVARRAATRKSRRKSPVARRAAVPRRAKAVEPAPAAPQVGASGFRNVQKPRTPGGVWSTSVTIEGSRTSAGSHATKEDAARAVDALLLAHGKPAVNFPGEEEVSRAAFPDITKAKPRAGTPSRKRSRLDDDTTAAEHERLRRELDTLRAATQSLERDLRASQAQRDEARGDAKRLRRERDEARKDAASSERALAALRQKFDRQMAAQRDVAPARPAKRGRHHYSPAEEPVDEARDAAEAEEVSPRQVQGADDNARASSDSDEAGDASFPKGAWVRHATTGVRGVVIGINSAGHGSRQVLGDDDKRHHWGIGMLESAPGNPPAVLMAEAAARCSKRGDWVRRKQTGEKGLIVKVHSMGWRTVLCDNDEELYWANSSFLLADGAPSAVLVAKAAAWSPADAGSSEEEDNEASFQVGAWVRDAHSTKHPHNSTTGGSGADGVVVDVRRGGWRTVLCADGQELKRRRSSLCPAPDAPPAALVAKAAAWSPADTESSEKEDDDASFPVESRQTAPAAGAAYYPVETLVEARFRRGDVFYPALVVAVRDGGRTLDLKYTDGDSEERVPLDFVRPLAPRQRSAPAAAVPEAPPPALTSKPEVLQRWTAEEENQLRKLVGELSDAKDPWSAIAARLGSQRSASACEQHWKYSMKGKTITDATAPNNYKMKACEVRRGNGPWRRFASQIDAVRKIPALTQSSLSGLINESRDGRQRSNCATVRGEYEARDYLGDGVEAVARRPPPAAPAEDAIAREPTSSVSYAVDTLVEARWRGGSKYYPALVLADNGQTIHVRYCDDSDEEETIAVSLVRPANRRLLQRYEQVTGKRPPPNVLFPPPPPPAPSSPRFAKGSKCVVPWSDGRKYAATVVSAGPDTARVEFEDGALKTVPLEDLESLSTTVHTSGTAETSQQIASDGIRCTSGRPDCYCKSQKSRAIVRYDPETGAVLETYCSVGAAADKLGVDVSTISHSLAGRNKAAGHAFRYRTPPPPRTKIPEALPVEAPPPPPPPPPPPLPTDPCAICMSTITEDACVLACGHAYHARCLGDLADHVRLAAPTRRSLGVSCPLCRKVTRAEVGAEED